jgi:hypothetical protein
MSADSSAMRRAAAWLLRHATQVLPQNRRHWAKAMAAEFDHIPSHGEALRWALGCVLASYSERIRSMSDTSPPVSRWMLCVEMLFCFTPLCLLFFTILANLDRLSLSDLETALYLSTALLGPTGLAIAFKAIALKRPTLPKAAHWMLALLSIWTLLAYPLHILAQYGGRPLDWWREFVLISLLPVLAAAHLLYLARSPKTAPPTTAG